MSFLGMGMMEIILILIIAFIFLGPERMVDAARLLGKVVQEGRNLASQVPRVVVEDDDIKLVSGGQTTSLSGQSTTASGAGAGESEDDGEPDGPVAFSRGSDAAGRKAQSERGGE